MVYKKQKSTCNSSFISKKMKSAVISTKDWDITECMSASRYVDYTEDDFKEIIGIAIDSWGTSCLRTKEGEIYFNCRSMVNCKVKKCNLKKAVQKYKALIIDNITKEKNKELEKAVNKIIASVEGIK